MLLHIIISFSLDRIIGCLILHKSSQIAINSMISSWIHFLLPLLLLLLDIWLLPEQHEDGEVFITDAMLLTVTCSWFCTRLSVFSLMCLCKNSFSSSYARFHSSILKENRRNIQKQSLGDVLLKRCSFVPRLHDVDISWPVLHKKVILTGDWFYPILFYQQ